MLKKLKAVLTSKIVWTQILTQLLIFIPMAAAELLKLGIAPPTMILIGAVVTLYIQQYHSSTPLVVTHIEGKNAMFIMNLLMILGATLEMAGVTDGIWGMSAVVAGALAAIINIIVRVWFLNQPAKAS
jgi:hypothetical protein